MAWDIVRIGDVAQIFDGPHATPPVCKDGAIFLGISNITQDGHFDFSSIKYISETDLPRWTKRVIPKKNDVVFSYEATLNLYAIIPDQFHGCLGRRMGLIRVDPSKLDHKFLFYYFFSTEWRRTVQNNIISGATVDRIPLIKFPSFPISLPSLEEQKKIASILSAYDSLIENNQKRIKLLEQMAENLYKEWFVRFRFPGFENTEFEGGVPKGWKVAKVKDCVNRLKFGTLYDKSTVDSEGDVIVIDQSQDPYIGFHNNAPSHVASITNPIVIFGDHSCKFELMIIPFSLAENVVPFMAKTGINTIFLFYSTHKLIQTTEYKRHWTEFVNKKIFVPPTDLQLLFAEKVKSCFTMKQNLLVENRFLIKQRDLLLPRLMSGKLSI